MVGEVVARRLRDEEQEPQQEQEVLGVYDEEPVPPVTQVVETQGDEYGEPPIEGRDEVTEEGATGRRDVLRE